jgi:hypothetical protein
MSKRWPLHPKPYDNQLLCDWIKDLAKIYEISYPNFCKRVLMLTSDEIYDLRNSVPERVLAILVNATGIAIDELTGRDLNSRCRQWGEEHEEMLAREKPKIICL